MKYINKLLLGAVSVLFMASCVEDSLLDYRVDKPESVVQQEYLNDYDVLKSYVDRSASPDFKLGAGVSLNAFNDKGLVYSHIMSNFDEVTAGYAMKHGAIVQNNGSMNFSGVEKFVATAQEAGVTIYGHTLAWHANQNAEYLNSIIADREVEFDPDATVEVVDGIKDYAVDPFDGWFGGPVTPVVQDGKLVVTNTEAQPNFWDIQYHVASGIPTIVGTNHKVTLRIKGSTAGEFTLALGTWGKTDNKTISITEEWQEVTTEFIGLVDNSFVMIQSGNYVGTYEIEWVKVTHQEAPSVIVPRYIYESDFSDGEPLGGWGNGSTRTVVDGELLMVNPSVVNFWEAQAAIDFPTPLTDGETYFLSMKIKGSAAGAVRPGFQDPSDYSSGGDFSAISFNTEWKEVTVQTTVTKESASRFLFSYGDFAGTIYIDDLKLYFEESANSLPLTPEEKADTLSWALDNWIAGMMEVSKDYVHAWDVVNEPMDDGNPYELKTGVGKTDMAADEFYWQDYLGKDYAVMAFNLAAQYGSPEDKLFINDYNLEYNIDKCKGLIKYVEYIEEQGARVDGIGTQMHINTNTDKDKIVEMFNLLAATGKLIKISELDMGIADGVITADATEADLQAQADMYQFVVEKYLELIPASQQYGITVWSPLDSPKESSWRADQPIGLWNLNYYRKPAYAGFADGLSGN
ncbi:endo-1,4-beta-xylanase [Draconibacterium orientale]|uniref:endo-1,4-beta-xylanase n=1 Tax=Draconibacterium orientale TaxID=1168034 RepID=UPI002ABD5538|nr:endo-1,4-beta-xylanase [Draconibacterium orientale]